MYKNIHSSLLVILVSTLILFPLMSVSGQVPDAQCSFGSGPIPLGAAQGVQLLDQSITIEIQPVKHKGTLGIAVVSGFFTFRNPGSETVAVEVGIPIGVAGGFQLTDLSVELDGVALEYEVQSLPVSYYGNREGAWAVFNPVFQPEKKSELMVSYTMLAGGVAPYAEFAFYLTPTGRWEGKINSSKLTFSFPYEINESNILSVEAANGKKVGRGINYESQAVIWHGEEPGTDSDLVLTTVDPTVWIKLLKNRQAVTDNKTDMAAWGRLGELYTQLLFVDGKLRSGADPEAPGIQHLVRSAAEAYSNAIQLDATKSAYHREFSDLLGRFAHFAETAGYDQTDTVERGVEELKQTLRLDTESLETQALLQNYLDWFPEYVQQSNDRIFFPEIKVRPTVKAQDAEGEPTVSPLPTTVPVPTATLFPGMQQPVDRGNPCLGGLLIPAGLLVLAKPWKQKTR